MKRFSLFCLAAFVALSLSAACVKIEDVEEPEPTRQPTATATAVPERSVEDIVQSADSLLERGEYAQAVSEYTELLRVLEDLDASSQDFAIVYMSRGLAHFGLEDYERAIADYDRALELDPTFADIYIARAQAYFHLGDEAAMLADFERAEAAGLDMSEFVVSLEEPVDTEPVTSTGDVIGDTSPETIARIADDIAPALAAIDDAPSSVEDAGASLAEFSAALNAAVDTSVDPWAIMQAGSLAEMQAAEADPDFVARVMAQDELLHGVMFDGEGLHTRMRAPEGKAVPLASGAPALATGLFRVYFVNGIQNTNYNAETSRAALQTMLKDEKRDHSVFLQYNHSFLENLNDYNQAYCRRALDFDSPPPDEGWADWLARNSMGGYCGAFDLAVNVGRAPFVAINQARQAIRGAIELYMQRIKQTDAASSAVTSELLPKVQDSLEAGYGVILIGHSQGTMFIQNVVQQIDRWWTERVHDGEACGPPPLGAIYIAPAIPVASRGNERYVLLNGDLIRGVSFLDPTATANAEQELKSQHSLDTYLMPGTGSRAQVIKHYDALKKEILERAEFGSSKVRVIINEHGKELTGSEGDTITYPIRLACKPDLEVTISLESYNMISFADSELLFDPRIPRIDWNVEQQVVVTIDEGALEDEKAPAGFTAIVNHTSRSADPTFNDLQRIAQASIEVLPKEPEPTKVPEGQVAPPILGEYKADLFGGPGFDTPAVEFVLHPCFSTIDGKNVNEVDALFRIYVQVEEEGVDNDGNPIVNIVEKPVDIQFNGAYFRDTGDVSGIIEGGRIDLYNEEFQMVEEFTPLDGTFTGDWNGKELFGTWSAVLDGEALKGTWRTTALVKKLPCY